MVLYSFPENASKIRLVASDNLIRLTLFCDLDRHRAGFRCKFCTTSWYADHLIKVSLKFFNPLRRYGVDSKS